MKTIIVPTDFSSVSVNAAMYATEMAVKVNADILLIHVVGLPVTISEVPVPASDLEHMIIDAKRSVLELKDKMLCSIKGKVNINTIVMEGDVIDEIANIAKHADIFGIVMGMQGSGAAVRTIFGSNTFAAMSGLPYAVIVIPGETHFKEINKICLAYDMHDVAQSIPVKSIERLIRQFNCSLDILYVSNTNEKMNKGKFANAGTLLHELVDVHPKFHFIVNKNIETGIADFVKKEHIDMLLIVPRQYGFFGSFFHQSVSKKIVMQCSLPMAALHTSPDTGNY